MKQRSYGWLEAFDIAEFVQIVVEGSDGDFFRSAPGCQEGIREAHIVGSWFEIFP